MLASLIAGFASGETLLALRRARNATIAYGLAAVSGLFGFMFLLGACFIAAASRFGAIWAAFGAAAVFFAIALAIVLVYKLSAGGRAKRNARRRNSDLTRIAIATGLAMAPTLLTGRVGKAALIAPAIAAVAYAIYKENSRPPGDSET